MTWVVSAKGVVIQDSRVLLAYNERQEWELPGGQLEDGESPGACVAREILEETALTVDVERLLDTWVFEVVPGKRVLILAYSCVLRSHPKSARVSAEHSAVEFVPLSRLAELALPDGYRRAIDLGAQPAR